MLFWVHQASGPIALGVLTIAVAAAVIGYVGRLARLAILVAAAAGGSAARATRKDRVVRSRGRAIVDCDGGATNAITYPGHNDWMRG